MSSKFEVIEDPNRKFIEDLVNLHYTRLGEAMSGPSLTAADLDAGPWYLEGEFGYVFDNEDSDRIADRAYADAGLGKCLEGWTTDYERYVVGETIRATVFRGIHWGRVAAGVIIDNLNGVTEIRR